MDKKILMISSADNGYHKNSLSSFTNTIPRGYLAANKKWKVSIESVGLHAQFVNAGVSKNNLFPALIQINKEHLRGLQGSNYSLYYFHQHNRFYLDPLKSYTLESLDSHFRFMVASYMHQNLRSFIGFPTRYNPVTKEFKIGQFDFFFERLKNGGDIEKYRNYVFLHKTFYDHISIYNHTDVKFVECTISGEPYLRFYVDGRSPVPIVTSTESLVKQIPKVIKIVSSSLSEVLDNDKKSKVIRVTNIPKTGLDNFVHFDFANKEWFEIEEKDLRSIDITLTDENDQQLRLSSGTPTYVKLHFCSSMEMKRFDVRMNSEKSQLNMSNEPLEVYDV